MAASSRDDGVGEFLAEQSAEGDWPCVWPECRQVHQTKETLRAHFDKEHLLTSLPSIHDPNHPHHIASSSTGNCLRSTRSGSNNESNEEKITTGCVFSSESLVIEPLDKDNVAELEPLEIQWLAEDPLARQSGAVGNLTAEEYRQRLEHQQGGGYIMRAPDRSEVLAFILHSTDASNIVTFEKLFVKPEYRQLGVATKLAELSVEDLRLRPAWPTVVRLIVSVANAHAVHMYRKYGLREVNAIRNYYGPGLHALAMQVVVNLTDYRRVLSAERVSSSLAMTMFTHGGLEICPVSYGPDGALVIHDCPFGGNLLSADEDRLFNQAMADRRRDHADRMQRARHFWLLDAPSSDQLLSPDDARALLDAGHLVTLELSSRYPRVLSPDHLYAVEGCSLVPSGHWRRLSLADPAVLLLSQDAVGLIQPTRLYLTHLDLSNFTSQRE